MGLVFGAILLLWGLMAVLVRYAKDPINRKESTAEDAQEMKERAAIAAVTIALAQASSQEPHEFPLPPTALVSAWQAVSRSNLLRRRGRVR
jgi:Na+-transporting methylmalonyl-CoA/oxaloacetate decarboxylase gamma subunit